MIGETKKQEAIRLAWESLVGLDNYQKIKERINFDGFCEWGIIFSSWPKFSNFEQKRDKFDNDMYVRPKSLQGIENNNGWITINSEEDFPKKEGTYWIVDKHENTHTIFFDPEDKFYRPYWRNKVTHYQPIQKPQPPIY